MGETQGLLDGLITPFLYISLTIHSASFLFASGSREVFLYSYTHWLVPSEPLLEGCVGSQNLRVEPWTRLCSFLRQYHYLVKLDKI